MSESKKIAEVEYRIDFLTNKLTGFFIKISTVTKFAGDEAYRWSSPCNHDIERLGDYAVLLVKETII